MLTQRQNFWLIIGPAVMMFAFALTSPIVQIYFIKLVDPQVLAIANMLGIGLAAAVNATVTKDKFLSWYRKHFFWIVSLDIISYVVICYTGTEYDATIRFIGLAITGAVSTTLWAVVMRSAVNDVLDGDRLTKWSSLSDSYKLAASFLGGTILFFLVDMPIEVALLIQCLANLFCGVTDIHAYRKLERA